MNKNYIIGFHLETSFQLATVIKAENSEIAINQAIGMMNREWVNIVDTLNNSVSFKSDKVIAIICEEELEE